MSFDLRRLIIPLESLNILNHIAIYGASFTSVLNGVQSWSWSYVVL